MKNFYLCISLKLVWCCCFIVVEKFCTVNHVQRISYWLLVLADNEYFFIGHWIVHVLSTIMSFIHSCPENSIFPLNYFNVDACTCIICILQDPYLIFVSYM